MALLDRYIADGAIAVWRFGESTGAGAAVDATGNGRDATYYNAPTLEAPGLVVGADTAATFNGTTQYAEAAWWAALGGSAALTVEVWFQTSATGSDQTLVYLGDDSSGTPVALTLRDISPPDLAFSLGSATMRSQGVADLRDGNPHHVVVTIPAAGTLVDAAMFIDGVRVSVAFFQSWQAKSVNSGPVRLARSAAGDHFSGTLDEVALYAADLHPCDAIAHYHEGKDTLSAHLAASLAARPYRYLRLSDDPTASSTMTDWSGNDASGGYYNGASMATAASLVAGDADGAITFDRFASTGGFIALPDMVSWSDASIEALIIGGVAEEGTIAGIVARRSNGQLPLLLRRTGAGVIRLQFCNTSTPGTSAVIDAPAALPAGVHHVVGVHDGSTARLYIDGVEVNSAPAAAAMVTTGYVGDHPDVYDTFLIAGRTTTFANYQMPATDNLSGTLDEVKVYDRALSPAEVAGLAASAAGNSASVQSVLRVDTFPRYGVRSYARVNIGTAAAVQSVLKADTAVVGVRSALRANVAASASISSRLAVDTQTDLAAAFAPGSRWGIALWIDGVDATHLLTGLVRTDWEISAAPVASFTLMPGNGVIDPRDYVSKPVVIEYRQLDAGDGTELWRLICYQGVIDSAAYRPDSATLFCRASADNPARIDRLPVPVVARVFGGHWSRHVYSDSAKGWAHAQDRLDTQRADLWHRHDGGVLILPWRDGAADIEWQGRDIVPGSITHQPPARAAIKNRVIVRLNYRYQRRRQRTLRCLWTTGVSFCDYLRSPFLLAQRSQIESAAAGGGGWQLIDAVHFDPMPPAGYYPCLPGFGAAKYIAWGSLVLGGYLTDDPDNDAFAWAARWTVSRRWLQDITELSEFEVVLADSVTANGVREAIDEYGIKNEVDHAEWLAARGYTSPDSGFVAVTDQAAGAAEGGMAFGDMVADIDNHGSASRAEFEEAQRTALAAAAAEAVRSHRHVKGAQSFFDPRIKPGTRLRLNVREAATGQVVAIRHEFDTTAGRARTTAEIGPFQNDGGVVAASDSLTPLAKQQAPATPVANTRLYFGTHIGGTTKSLPYNPGWTGYTTNRQFDDTNTDPFAANSEGLGNRAYPNQFVVEYPEIDEADIRAEEVNAAKRVEIAIPDDELVITQTGVYP